MTGEERLVGNVPAIALMAILALSPSEPRIAAAQGVSQGNPTHGTFGNRPLGQPLVPRPSNFGGGIQTGSSGNFLYRGRPDGSTAFAAPWRQVDPAKIEQAADARSAGQPIRYNAPSPQSPAPEYNFPEFPTIPEFAPPPLFEMTGWEGPNPADQGIGMGLGIEPPAAWNINVPRAGTRAASASAVRPQLSTRSPELSDRLTRIARTKGILVGQGIDVYLSNSIAILQGTVRTSGDCALLASVLALEPEVRQIDNRLVAEGAGAISSNCKSP
jgi:hypothetical protein